MTGPILGPSVPAGAATGALEVTRTRYSTLDASEAGSSRGNEEEEGLIVKQYAARQRVPWYKDFQVKRRLQEPDIVPPCTGKFLAWQAAPCKMRKDFAESTPASPGRVIFHTLYSSRMTCSSYGRPHGCRWCWRWAPT